MQSILDIKYKLEEQEKIAYSIASQRLAQENEKLKQLMARRIGYEKKAEELAVGIINVLKIRENKRAIDTMKSLIREQIMQVHAAEKNRMKSCGKRHLNSLRWSLPLRRQRRSTSL